MLNLKEKNMKVELKKWSSEDKESLIEICNTVDRRYLANRLPFPYTEDSAEWWLHMVGEHDGIDGIFRAIVVDGKVVGNITVEQKEDVYGKDAELGYLLRTDEWSKGIMTEATRQICKIAFRELNIIRITGLIYEPNISSRRVLEKNGFILEGIMRNAVAKDENIYNLCVYGKLKTDKCEDEKSEQ